LGVSAGEPSVANVAFVLVSDVILFFNYVCGERTKRKAGDFESAIAKLVMALDASKQTLYKDVADPGSKDLSVSARMKSMKECSRASFTDKPSSFLLPSNATANPALKFQS
jgi:hypothetical protein